MADSDRSESTESIRPAADATRKGPPRWRLSRFVLVFILSASVLLISGRYAVNTRPMNWYLFQVARPTAWILGLVGQSAKLEDPAPYAGRADAIRAALPGSTASDTPLSSYEVWQFRALGVRLKRVEARQAAKELTPLPLPNAPTPEEYVEYVRARLDQLARSIAPRGEATEYILTCPGLAEFMSGATERLNRLARAGDKTGETFTAEVNALSDQVESFRLRQVAYLEERAHQLAAQEVVLGPGVDFVARAATEETAEARFQFHVVPDCGALPSMSIFMAAILAFPAAWRKRAAGIFVGIPLLFTINVLRLACLGVIGAYTHEGEIFTFAHEYVWQGIYLVFVAGIWLLWVEYIVRPARS
jgi:exosortase/archaeosortase family protein